jgi:CarD family transcriptional regulator
VTVFHVGDAVVHPARGAGVVVGLEEFRRNGDAMQYYDIELLGQSSTSLMVPVENAEEIGLRLAIPRARLKRVWRTLSANPDVLPSDYKARHSLMEEKLQTGKILQVAEAVRDMAWRQRSEGLTKHGKQIYQRAMTLLAAEVAATQGVDLERGKSQVIAQLRENLPPRMAT